MVRKLFFFSALLFVMVFIAVYASSCRHEPYIPEHTVCFRTEIHPVISNRCAMPGCHSGTGGEEEIRPFITYEDIMSSVSPGNPNESELYKSFLHHSGEANITVKPTSYEKAIVKLWIEQGAVNDTTCH